MSRCYGRPQTVKTPEKWAVVSTAALVEALRVDRCYALLILDLASLEPDIAEAIVA